jgi:putative FmdB family regulatory protein
MPLYEYKCDKCSKSFEFLQSIKDTPKNECPECKGHLSKLISVGSFQLKGSGWYDSDYKNKGNSACPSASPTACRSCPKAATS